MTTKKHYMCDNGVNFNAYYSDIEKFERMGIDAETCLCDYCEFNNECNGSA